MLTLLTDTLIANALEFISQGASPRQALMMAGLNKHTASKWLTSGRNYNASGECGECSKTHAARLGELVQQLETKRAEFVLTLQKKIYHAGEDTFSAHVVGKQMERLEAEIEAEEKHPDTDYLLLFRKSVNARIQRARAAVGKCAKLILEGLPLQNACEISRIAIEALTKKERELITQADAVLQMRLFRENKIDLLERRYPDIYARRVSVDWYKLADFMATHYGPQFRAYILDLGRMLDAERENMVIWEGAEDAEFVSSGERTAIETVASDDIDPGTGAME